MSKYGVFSGPFFPAFGLNTEISNINHYIVWWSNKTSWAFLTMKITTTNLPYPTASLYIAREILSDHFRIKWWDPTQQNILVYIFKKQNNFLQILFYFERFKHARSKLWPQKIFRTQSHSDCLYSACNCVKNVQIRSFF